MSIGTSERRTAPATFLVAGILLAATLLPTSLTAQSLRGSPRSLDIQNDMAHRHDFSYLANSGQVARFVEGGYLVEVRGDRNFVLDNEVSFPYARPEVLLFLQRLGSQYRSACGEQLVVTSLTRPLSRQPANASDRSVHPTGMALDLRLSSRTACRAWLEDVLLSLERSGVLEATRERWPPHYHVALFPDPYTRYVTRITGGQPEAVEPTPEPDRLAASFAAASSSGSYEVRPGDSLWEIAQQHGVSSLDIRIANGLSSSRIYPGQRLRIPDTDVSDVMVLAYQVQPGDSLWEIARAHRTTVTSIRQENGLRSDRIDPGQVLTVPIGR